MGKKLTSLIGIKKEDFDEFRKTGEIQFRYARLIPVLKTGDEMALTSVFLSSIKIITEFRNMILSDLKMMKGGQIFVYTEIKFPSLEQSRIDGLIIIVKNGVIKDAAVLEMKNGSNELETDQIQKYIEIAKKHSIPKLITVSNQFVSEPTQFPLPIKTPKDVTLFHFSWTYLLTIAHLLLFKNDINIEDEVQVEIMKEVVAYLENDKSGVCGFNQMKPGWKAIVEKINSGKNIKMNDSDLNETVNSWKQEEKDMALILSKKLGVIVKSSNFKYKGNLSVRLEDDKKKVMDIKELSSVLKIKGAVSDIKVIAFFRKRTVEMAVNLSPPDDKTLKGKIGWLKRQIDICGKKSTETFQKIKGETFIEVTVKNSSISERVNIDEIDSITEKLKDRELRDCKIIYIKDFGKSFSNRKDFVLIIEKMLIDYYTGIVQYLKNWEKPAPQVVENKPTIEDIEVKENEELT